MEWLPLSRTNCRAGNPAELVGSSEKAKKVLGWELRYAEIDTIMAHAWEWHKKGKFEGTDNGYCLRL